MATLTIEFNNAYRQPLDDVIDVDVRSVQTNALMAQHRGVSGRSAVRVDGLVAGQSYKVRVVPMRYRAVQQFASVPVGQDSGAMTIYCPVNPRAVTRPGFPPYDSLPEALRAVLDRSTLEHEPSRSRTLSRDLTVGERLFSSLGDTQRAGLLNLFVKMTHTPLADGTPWDYVNDLYRVRGDRIFCNVSLGLRDQVKDAVSAGTFREVPGGKHKPDHGFSAAGSFKTADHYGNLQLTFFGADAAPQRFRVDADIDDAAGIEHGFQVISHDLTHGVTNPYDIHQILTFYQRLDVGYLLPV